MSTTSLAAPTAAEHIPTAELVELRSGDHVVAVDADQIVAAVQSWVTGRSGIVLDQHHRAPKRRWSSGTS